MFSSITQEPREQTKKTVGFSISERSETRKIESKIEKDYQLAAKHYGKGLKRTNAFASSRTSGPG